MNIKSIHSQTHVSHACMHAYVTLHYCECNIGHASSIPNVGISLLVLGCEVGNRNLKWEEERRRNTGELVHGIWMKRKASKECFRAFRQNIVFCFGRPAG